MARTKKAKGFRVDVVCESCGKSFSLWECDRRKFCSVKCYGKSMTKRKIIYAYGDKFYLRTHGYYSSNLTGKYLHRVVWENERGIIPENHIVHHKDGNTKNNSVDNLEIMTHDVHMRNHYEKKNSPLRIYNESRMKKLAQENAT